MLQNKLLCSVKLRSLKIPWR